MGALLQGRRDDEEADKLSQVEQVLTRKPIAGINRKLQLKPLKWDVRRCGDGQECEVGAAVVGPGRWGVDTVGTRTCETGAGVLCVCVCVYVCVCGCVCVCVCV